MRKILFFLLSCSIIFCSCDRLYDSPIKGNRVNIGANEPAPQILYAAI